MNVNGKGRLRLVTGSARTIDAHVSYREMGQNRDRLPGSQQTAITTATTTTILDGPNAAYVARVIESIAIRNKDSSSCDVTVTLDDGTTTIELYKTTLAAGGQLFFNESDGWSLPATSPSGSVLITATTDTANSAVDTLANVTGLTVAVEANDTYRFRAMCVYTADATTSGSRWTVNGPAMTAVRYRSNYALTTTSETVNNGLVALQQPAAANATSAATTGNVAIVEGVFTPSAAGTFAVQFAAEAGTITAKAGSTLEIQKLIDA